MPMDIDEEVFLTVPARSLEPDGPSIAVYHRHISALLNLEYLITLAVSERYGGGKARIAYF